MGGLMSNKRAALYVRVSTDAQTVENQIRELRQVAGRRGWDVAEVYNDAGISGVKGRNGRPGLDSMLKDASRRKFDIVMAWAIDRLGRSLIDLLDTIRHLEACGVDLYLDQQAIDTTTPRWAGSFSRSPAPLRNLSGRCFAKGSKQASSAPSLRA
jgi:DNA invertase Pin-like site-specific DNA recombinase